MKLKDLNYRWLIPAAVVLVIAAVAGTAAISRVSRPANQSADDVPQPGEYRLLEQAMALARDGQDAGEQEQQLLALVQGWENLDHLFELLLQAAAEDPTWLWPREFGVQLAVASGWVKYYERILPLLTAASPHSELAEQAWQYLIKNSVDIESLWRMAVSMGPRWEQDILAYIEQQQSVLLPEALYRAFPDHPAAILLYAPYCTVSDGLQLLASLKGKDLGYLQPRYHRVEFTLLARESPDELKRRLAEYEPRPLAFIVAGWGDHADAAMAALVLNEFVAREKQGFVPWDAGEYGKAKLKLIRDAWWTGIDQSMLAWVPEPELWELARNNLILSLEPYSFINSGSAEAALAFLSGKADWAPKVSELWSILDNEPRLPVAFTTSYDKWRIDLLDQWRVSPDGRWICLSGINYRRDPANAGPAAALYLYNFQSKELITLSPGAYQQIHWSPDSGHLALVTEDRIMILNTTGAVVSEHLTGPRFLQRVLGWLETGLWLHYGNRVVVQWNPPGHEVQSFQIGTAEPMVTATGKIALVDYSGDLINVTVGGQTKMVRPSTPDTARVTGWLTGDAGLILNCHGRMYIYTFADNRTRLLDMPLSDVFGTPQGVFGLLRSGHMLRLDTQTLQWTGLGQGYSSIDGNYIARFQNGVFYLHRLQGE